MPQNEIYATLSVTQPAGIARLFKVLVKDRNGADFTALGGGTYFGEMQNVKTHERVVFPVSVSPVAENVLLLHFPALSAGRWLYEVYLTADGGERDRLVCGLYSTLETVADNTAANAVTPYDATLVLGYDGEVLSAYFNATSRAEQAVEEARSLLGTVQHSIDLLKGAEYVIDTLQKSVQQAFSIGSNGNWFVGDVDTGRPSRGERGMNADEVQYHLIASPVYLPTDAAHCNPNHRYLVQGREAVAASGWVEFVQSPAGAGDFLWLYINGFPVIVETPDGSLQQWADVINTNTHYGVTAVVDDNFLRLTARMAGAAGNNIALQARDASGQVYMPTSGNKLDGGEDAELTEQYIWVEEQWTMFPLNAPARATRSSDGFVRVSTDEVIADGVPVGFNSEGQLVGKADSLTVPDATATTKGKVLLAATIEDDGQGVVPAGLLKWYLDKMFADWRASYDRELQDKFMQKGALQVVDALPEVQEEGVIYLVRES